ncbi:MAG: hypothetical protein EOM80_04520 [Erysipelotrichia bacterium]|nr:hypothetical protein [Erysipelotrichia bacterium]
MSRQRSGAVIVNRIMGAFLLFVLVQTCLASQLFAESVTMYTMNSPMAIKRISNGHFSLLYRGFGSRKADKIERDELLGFHFLIDTDCLSHGMRALITENQKNGMQADEALRAARRQHVTVLRDIFKRIESTRLLFENCANKSQMTSQSGIINPESHFIFTSPRIGVARFYGPIVMVIEEKTPRGMDLNGIARESKYYSVGRFLRNLSDFSFKQILADYVADRDEYVIPSFLSPQDVSGLIVHAPSPVVIGNRIAIPPPAIRRVYRKYNRLGAMTIDVLDGKDRLIARLSASPSAAVIEASEVLSHEVLPSYIQLAWDKYVKTLRRAGNKR